MEIITYMDEMSKKTRLNKYIDRIENVVGRELTINEIIDLKEGLETRPLGVEGFVSAFIEQIYEY